MIIKQGGNVKIKNIKIENCKDYFNLNSPEELLMEIWAMALEDFISALPSEPMVLNDIVDFANNKLITNFAINISNTKYEKFFLTEASKIWNENNKGRE